MRASLRRLARAAIGLAAAGGLMGSAAPAFATDCGSLQAALTAAQAGDTVTLDQGSVCAGPYTLPSAAITLQGGGTGATIQGAAGSRALSGADVGATTVTNLTFTNGGGSGGGGAVMITGSSTPTFSNDLFLANSTSGGTGGALSIVTSAASGTVTVESSTFGDGTTPNRNHSDTGGGALYISSGTAVAITNSAFKGNATDENGGGGALVSLTGGADLTASGNTFDSNSVAGVSSDLGGGGLRVAETAGSAVTATSNTFHANQIVAGNTGEAGFGGGLYLTYGVMGSLPSAVLSKNTFDANSISGGSASAFVPSGGAVATNLVSLSTTSDQFVKNVLSPGTGTGRGAALALMSCDGSSSPPEDTVVQAVIAGNSVNGGAQGGSIFQSCPQILAVSSLRIRQTTLIANASSKSGSTSGLWGGPYSNLTIQNSIFGPNPGGGELVGYGTRSVSYSDMCVSGAPVSGAGNICADPLLADPAAGDIYQTASSPTVDAGSNSLASGLSSDYLGQSRIVDGDFDGTSTVDMGADERRAETSCSRLNDEFARDTDSAVIHLSGGQTCTGSYTLPAAQISLIGDGGGVTFKPTSGRSFYGKDVQSTVFSNLTFTGGSGAPGGAVFLEGASTPTFDGVTFVGNSSSDEGGGLAINSTGGSGRTTLVNSVFGDGTVGGTNSATRGGGAAIHPGPTRVFITQTSFTGNTATAGAGGGLYLDRGTADHTFKNVQFTGNTVIPDSGFNGTGGGAYVGANPAGVNLLLAGVKFDGNQIGVGSGTLSGAGLAVVGTLPTDQVEQSNNRFRNNTFTDASSATRVLGAGESVTGAALKSHEDQWLNNVIGSHGSSEADGVGLGLDNCNPDFPGTTHHLTNDVFANNVGPGDVNGAALYVNCKAGSVSMVLSDSTLVGQSAGIAAVVWGDLDEHLTVANSIFWPNSGPNVSGFDAPSVTFSVFCNGAAPEAGAGNLCTDPLLKDISKNDVHQSPNSPTIDTGSNAAVPSGTRIDYEGHERIQDSNGDGSSVVDIGADEQQPIGHVSPGSEAGAPVDFVLNPPPGADEGTPGAEDAPGQLVADVKVSGGKKKATKKKAKKCGDNTGPTSRFLNRLSKAAKFKGLGTLLIRGEARYKKCKGHKAGKIKRVNFTIKLVLGTKCRFLTKTGTLGSFTSCKRKATLFRAKGTTKWSYTLRGPLPAGKYLAQVQAVDNLGNKERASSHRNFRHFRINGTQLRQGWSGTHPDDYTKRG